MFTHQCAVCYKHWIIEGLLQLTFPGKQIHSSCHVLRGSATTGCLNNGMWAGDLHKALSTPTWLGGVLEGKQRQTSTDLVSLEAAECATTFTFWKISSLSGRFSWNYDLIVCTLNHKSNHFLLLSAADRFPWYHDSSHTIIWWLSAWIISVSLQLTGEDPGPVELSNKNVNGCTVNERILWVKKRFLFYRKKHVLQKNSIILPPSGLKLVNPKDWS